MNLIVNAGSSTYKYAFFEDGKRILEMIYSQDGKGLAHLTISQNGLSQSIKISRSVFEHSFDDLFSRSAVRQLLEVSPLKKIGFRLVHGGSFFQKPTRYSRQVHQKLAKLNDLAPLHNPFALQLLEIAQRRFPRVALWLLFDTSFHSTLPPESTKYALPSALLEKYHLRRYGFHGIAYESVVHQLRSMKKLPKRLIACHLGSGCSVTAIRNGESIDTSMGFTPMDGLIMATRAGDLDPGLMLFLQEHLSGAQLSEILNHQSGLKALAGTSDMKLILMMKKLGNKSAVRAVKMFCERVAKYIAHSIVSLKGVDRIVFSGGIGENAAEIREQICEDLKAFGVSLHKGKNLVSPPGVDMQRFFSSAKISVLHVDEAEEINRFLEKG